jgi:uncharacterized protein YwgA
MVKDQTGWEPKSGLDALLMLLYAPENDKDSSPIAGITRLDKLMFILSKTSEFEALFEGDYKFIPYNFGPFATELLDDLEALVEEGIIKRSKSTATHEASETRDAEVVDEETGELPDSEINWDMYSYDIYSLSDKGKEIAARIFSSAASVQQKRIVETKGVFNKMPLSSLLRYVYEKFPDYAEESSIKDKVLAQ